MEYLKEQNIWKVLMKQFICGIVHMSVWMMKRYYYIVVIYKIQKSWFSIIVTNTIIFLP